MGRRLLMRPCLGYRTVGSVILCVGLCRPCEWGGRLALVFKRIG